MRRMLLALALALVLIALAVPAYAGSPHFVDDKVTFTVDGDTVTVVFKEAGLGDEDQVHVVLSGDAACVNPGGNKPQAANKESFSAAGDFPVQNGRTEGSLSVTATFQPSCSPPMTVQWSNLVLTDETSGISTSP
ncbi:MAG TPA: hypothetical protein VK942_01830 [Actinomycetes bacterium]|nr:hypothetical protein [Actinomycetes bacterium]